MRRFARDREGATAVEFALLALPFFLIVFATLEIAMLFMAELSLDSAVDRVGREVRTGQLDTTDMTQEKFRKHLCEQMTSLIDCAKLKIDLRSYPTYGDIDPAPPADNAIVYQRGGPGEIMALRVYYVWPLLTDLMRAAISGGTGFRLTSIAAFRSEYY
ncbi:TadE/TadG family type IV pilus assembly protein [Aureimonas sp. ME7]|uniref:TadE/TadG family type IV pilus assembly protein n=1 Tax=Aureimonas sp. ME7 TaxID=2744252 RepID=UPI0015F73FB6|nr:TadE/TadG family type IV pilus assembly protein [Aureimonas sp. ME7]